jgi:hypothetical protein
VGIDKDVEARVLNFHVWIPCGRRKKERKTGRQKERRRQGRRETRMEEFERNDRKGKEETSESSSGSW